MIPDLGLYTGYLLSSTGLTTALPLDKELFDKKSAAV